MDTLMKALYPCLLGVLTLAACGTTADVSTAPLSEDREVSLLVEDRDARTEALRAIAQQTSVPVVETAVYRERDADLHILLFETHDDVAADIEDVRTIVQKLDAMGYQPIHDKCDAANASRTPRITVWFQGAHGEILDLSYGSPNGGGPPIGMTLLETSWDDAGPVDLSWYGSAPISYDQCVFDDPDTWDTITDLWDGLERG